MFFFFFKQKTAYEMRISDWSSDVCSSDLQAERAGRGGGGTGRGTGGAPGRVAATPDRRVHPAIGRVGGDAALAGAAGSAGPGTDRRGQGRRLCGARPDAAGACAPDRGDGWRLRSEEPTLNSSH